MVPLVHGEHRITCAARITRYGQDDPGPRKPLSTPSEPGPRMILRQAAHVSLIGQDFDDAAFRNVAAAA